jgi:hypothetical protein
MLHGCSSLQAVAVMGLQLEGDGLAVADLSMHTELERTVLYAALQHHVNILTSARLRWFQGLDKRCKAGDGPTHHLCAALSSTRCVKSLYMLLACNFKDGGLMSRGHTLLQMGEALTKLREDDEERWTKWRAVLHPYLMYALNTCVQGITQLGDIDKCQDLVKTLKLLHDSLAQQKAD